MTKTFLTDPELRIAQTALHGIKLPSFDVPVVDEMTPIQKQSVKLQMTDVGSKVLAMYDRKDKVIWINPDGEHFDRNTSAVHEYGHAVLDHATQTRDAELARKIVKVLDASFRTKLLADFQYRAAISFFDGTADLWEYELNPHEVWARAFAQYVMTKDSQNARRWHTMYVHAQAAHRDLLVDQWDPKDFAEVKHTFEKEFR